MLDSLTPKEIVKKLDEFIIGQDEAKKAVAIALRNRSRRMALKDDPIQEEIHPKNIIMMGPTGVGKTEIARRLANLENAPFVKVEDTKYTEVGYVGRDVESMIRDLVANSLKIVREEYKAKIEKKAKKKTEQRILEILISGEDKSKDQEKDDEDEEIVKKIFEKKLKDGKLEDKEIELKTTSQSGPTMQIMAVPGMEEIENQLSGMMGDMFPKKQKKRKLKIKNARKILFEEELENLLDIDKIKEEAIRRAEQTGIVFIDEIDKVASKSSTNGSPNISREGVQRDILPIVEGSTINTRNGSIKTDHILFIAAGAFHFSSVSDLIPELQGRFPIRVELKSLTKKDYIKILQHPKNALSKQYLALLSTENIALKFEKSGFDAIADIAYEMNTKNENIGARRLHAVMEKLLEEVSFNSEEYKDKEIVIDEKYVRLQLDSIVKDQDLSKYIL